MRVSFTEHPASVGESYAEHLRMASSFGGAMLLGGMACLLHGLLPFLFTRTGSATIMRLHQRMVTNRTARPETDLPETAPPQTALS